MPRAVGTAYVGSLLNGSARPARSIADVVVSHLEITGQTVPVCHHAILMLDLMSPCVGSGHSNGQKQGGKRREFPRHRYFPLVVLTITKEPLLTLTHYLRMKKWIALPGTGLSPLLARIVALQIAFDRLETFILATDLLKKRNHALNRAFQRYEALRQH
jgi:hypothetical protein